MRTRAQATLEFTVAFFLMVILLYSLLMLWKKFSDKIIERQHDYSGKRVISGTYDVGLGPTIPYLP